MEASVPLAAQLVLNQSLIGVEAAAMASEITSGNDWEVEYQAWLDTLDVISRIDRGMRP
jgi:hypothetical protein